MKFIYIDIPGYGEIHEVLDTLINRKPFPDYIVKNREFKMEFIERIGINEGKFHTGISNFLQAKGQSHYYMAAIYAEAEMNCFCTDPIIKVFTKDDEESYQCIFKISFFEGKYGFKFEPYGFGYFMYFNEHADWLVVSEADLGIQFIAVRSASDIQLFLDAFPGAELVDRTHFEPIYYMPNEEFRAKFMQEYSWTGKL